MAKNGQNWAKMSNNGSRTGKKGEGGSPGISKTREKMGDMVKKPEKWSENGEIRQKWGRISF